MFSFFILLFLGGVGVGEIHLASALGYQACIEEGHSVLFATATPKTCPFPLTFLPITVAHDLPHFGDDLLGDGLQRAEFMTYLSKPIPRLLANNPPRETTWVTAAGLMPNTADTAAVVIPNSRIAQ